MSVRPRKIRPRDRLLAWLDVPLNLPMLSPRKLAESFRVCGDDIFVRSTQCDLSVSPEALASAFLLPAASLGRRLSGCVVDPLWLDGAGKILEIAHDWWGWRAGYPLFKPGFPSRRENGVGLAFSLGIDSFYSCFFADPTPEILVFAAGYDVPMERKQVLGAMCRSVAEVAEAMGAQWVSIETNLRKHRMFRTAPWDIVHGGALAMLGHLISDRCGSFVISSSFQQGKLGPWGSHPDLDPLWSSSALRIEHFGDDVSRLEKLRRLLNHPEARTQVQRHLRVCWVAPDELGNCGKCRKCTLLRASLAVCEPGFQLRTMPDDLPLLDAINSLAPCKDKLVLNFWRELLDGDNSKLDSAIRDLVARSEVELAL